ncbi:MAG: MlaD family protein [Thermodesulfobacteriota bacterium]|nr:MlaD family protein [Thermodesulfobacteriota bacterium]
MSGRANYFKIGLFVIVATTLAVVSVIILGAGALFQKKTLMESYFEESVQGLEVGSPVKFRGVGIGNVELITLVDREYATALQHVLVRVGLSSDVWKAKPKQVGDLTEEIERGLRVRLAFQGLTGTAYLEADYLDPERNPPLKIDWTPRYCYIPSAPSTITRLSESLDRIMRRLEQVKIDRITEVVETSLKAFTQATEDVDLKETNAQAQELLIDLRETNRLIAESLKGGRLESILSDTSATMGAARRIVEGSEPSLAEFPAALLEASRNVEAFTKRLDAMSQGLPDAFSRLKEILHEIDDLLSSQQQDIAITVRNIKAASENLRELTENATRYPAQVLFGEPPSPVDPQGE